jgi:hypothetical protein
MKALRIIISIILALGGMMIFNESDTFLPNFIGLACLALLVAINIDKDTLEKIQR